MIGYAWRLVIRNPRRTLTNMFGLALAVGLFAGILFFVDATARQMTTLALAPVKVDLIAHATKADVAVTAPALTLAQQRGITMAEPVIAADFASALKVGTTQSSPAGRIFAITPQYLQKFDVVQLSAGTFDVSGAVVSEAMAVGQHLQIGDTLQMTFAGLAQPVAVPVTGIANLDNADALFATTTEAENALVADVVFVDATWFGNHLQAPLAALAANPPTTLPPTAVILDPQIHLKLDRSLLPADPAVAALRTDALRRQVERQFPGQLKVVDNLSRTFKAAKGDVLAAKILFIFLGLPGVALAAYLTRFAAALFAETQRREVALLRTRGATPRQILVVLAVAAVLLAIGGTTLGLVIGMGLLLLSVTNQAGVSMNPFGSQFDWGSFTTSALVAFGLGLLLTFLSAFVPAMRALQREITTERRTFQRTVGASWWQRLYLDIVLLVGAAVVLFITWRNGGFKPSGNEGAAITLSFFIFLAPLGAWLGFTLLTLRLVQRGLVAHDRRLAGVFRRLLGPMGEVAGKSVARRAQQIGAATTVIALTLSFGVSLALFQRTYTDEKQRDAQYVVGADLRVTPALNTPQTVAFSTQLLRPNVKSVTAVARDTQALVGAEKNTIYGIDVPSFRQTAYLPDSFFVDGSAQQTVNAMRDHTSNYAPGTASTVLDALARTPNGVIISVEQAEKYNIQVGDPVLLRLYNRTTQTYTNVQAQTVGLFVYFPTSAQDSDFILNRDFMTASSGNNAMDYFLLKTVTPVQTSAVATALTNEYRNQLPLRIQTTDTVVKLDQSSLTALNLGGLGRMEQIYTLLVISVGFAIFLLAMINERQREFGTMRALGAAIHHLRRFVVVEALTIGGLSLGIGVLVGTILARMLVLLLGIIFTIPAVGLIWPYADLLILLAVVCLGMVVSTLLSTRRLAAMQVVESLRVV